MADLNRLLLDNLALAFGVLAALVLLLLIGFAIQSARLRERDSHATASSSAARTGAPSTTAWSAAPSRPCARPSA